MAFSRVIQPWSQGGMKNMGKDLAQNCPQQIPCCPPLLQPRPLCTLFQPLWNECLTAAVSLALPGPCGSPSRVAGTALGSQPRVARWGLSRQRCFPCAASVTYSCCCLADKSCSTLHPVVYSLPGSSVHRILHARVLEWVAVSFSRASSRPRE